MNQPALDYSQFRLHWPPYTMCKNCHCTNDDCHRCIELTGEPCSWVAPYLCSACVDEKTLQMTTQQVVAAIEDGQSLSYHNPKHGEREGHELFIHPYRNTDKSVGFHLGGWGSAGWRAIHVFEALFQCPERFQIMNDPASPALLKS